MILLTIGIPGIIHHNERVATELLRKGILGAESPFEHWLHRDLLLAGMCLADDVGIDMECEDEIIERILCLALTLHMILLGDDLKSTYIVAVDWLSRKSTQNDLPSDTATRCSPKPSCACSTVILKDVLTSSGTHSNPALSNHCAGFSRIGNEAH